MASLANTTLYGNVGGEVRTREVNTSRGMQTVLNFSVATSHGYGERETTTWWSVDYFCNSEKARDTLTRSIHKGARVLAVGEPYTRTYENKQGETVTVNQFDARMVFVISNRLAELAAELGVSQQQIIDLARATWGTPTAQPPASAQPEQGAMLYDEDIPF